MIGDGNIDHEYVDDRPQQTLGLSKRLVEYREEPVPASRDGILVIHTVSLLRLT
jgi:hypothetical protein